MWRVRGLWSNWETSEAFSIIYPYRAGFNSGSVVQENKWCAFDRYDCVDSAGTSLRTVDLPRACFFSSSHRGHSDESECFRCAESEPGYRDFCI